jgi:hypothetical protein
MNMQIEKGKQPRLGMITTSTALLVFIFLLLTSLSHAPTLTDELTAPVLSFLSPLYFLGSTFPFVTRANPFS